MTGQPSDEVIETEVRRLNDFFDLNQGFGLVLIFADPSDVLDGFMRRLQSDHGPGHILFPESNDLTEQALALTYPNQAPSAAYTCFFANRQGTHGEDNRRNLLGRLNERRDQLRAHLGMPFLLILPHGYHIRCRAYAPDLWHVRHLTLMLSVADTTEPTRRATPLAQRPHPFAHAVATPPTELRIPQGLWDALRSGSVVLLLGPELVSVARMPSFGKFLQQFKEQLEGEGYFDDNQKGMLRIWLDRPADHPRAAKLLRDLDKIGFQKALTRAYDPGPDQLMIQPPSWLAALGGLGFKGILYSGFDFLLRDALPTWSSLTWQDEFKFGSIEHNWICWLHGRVDQPGTVVCDLDQYKRFEANQKPLRNWLDKVLAQQRILALGFREHDLLLDQLKELCQPTGSLPWFAEGEDRNGFIGLDPDSMGHCLTRLAQYLNLQISSIPLTLPEIERNGWLRVDQTFLAGFAEPNLNAVQRFYRGEPAYWALVYHEKTFKRSCAEELWKELDPEGTQNRIVLVLASGGEGKSTLLKQMGLRLLDEGYQVFEAQHGEADPFSILKSHYDKLALLIDNAAELKNLAKLFKFILNRKTPIRVILAARENEWQYHQENSQVKGLYRPVHLGRLTEIEAEDLAHLLKKAGADHIERSEAELKQAILEETAPFLLATMLMATEGRDLMAILEDVVINISKFEEGEILIKALGLVCAIENLARKTNPDYYCGNRLFRRFFDISQQRLWQVFAQLKGEVSLEVVGNRVETRHPLIGEVLYSLIFHRLRLLNEFELWQELIRTAGKLARESPEGNERNFLSILPIYYKNSGNHQQARDLFQLASQVLPNEATIWQAWAVMENEVGNRGSLDIPHSARWLFQKAIAVDPKNPKTWQAWGELEAKQGHLGNTYTRMSARWMFNHALELEPTSAHTWHTWARLEWQEGNRDLAEELVQKGLVQCPNNTFLQDLANELERNPTTRSVITRKPEETQSKPQKPHKATKIPASGPTPKLFISYSKKDLEWKDQISAFLRPLQQRGLLELWDDSMIRPGTNWRDEMQAALDGAQVALLLVSPDFLASDIIQNQELPYLLNAAKARGLKIYWLLVRSCLYEFTELNNYQAVIPPQHPLATMSRAEVDEALTLVAKKIVSALESPESDS